MSLKTQRRAARSGAATSLVVFLHGYGADGADLIGLADPLGGHLPETVFLAPDGPEPNRVNPMGRQWFPIPLMDGSSQTERVASFRRSTGLLDDWLTAALEAEGVEPERTCLVGFSQGTMMSLHVGPRRTAALAGIVGFSGMRLTEEADGSPVLTRPPVLLVHGDADQVIPVTALDHARDGLAKDGFQVRWHVERGLGHGIGPEGLGLALDFLKARLGAP